MGLAGLLAWRGLPTRRIDEADVRRIFRAYRDAILFEAQKEQKTGTRPLDVLQRENLHTLPAHDQELVDSCRSVGIRFIGLFDTVRAAGHEVFHWRGTRQPCEVPEDVKERDPGTLALRYTRHLPSNVERAYHALAIDEHRAVFHPRVWIIRDFAQCTLSGSNNGGSPVRTLISAADIPTIRSRRFALKWMWDKATEAGMELNGSTSANSAEHLVLSHAMVVRTYDEWLLHLYRFISRVLYMRPIHRRGLRLAQTQLQYEPQQSILACSI